MKVTSRWPTALLGEVVEETQYGTSLKANEQCAGVPVLRMNNITYSGALDLTDIKHVELPAKDIEQYSVRRGDLLFNRTNSQELVGKMGVWNRDESFAFAGYLVRLRLKTDRADPSFVAAWFNTTEMKTLLRTRAKPSINMSNINATEVLKFPIVLPPLAEQRRIAEVLDRAEALRAKRRAALAQLDSLTQSLFLDLFGDPALNPKTWTIKPMGTLFSVKHGFAFKSEYFTDTGEFVLLTPGNFHEEGGYRERGDKQKFYVGSIPTGYILAKDDLLVAMTEQAPGLLGSPILVPESNRFLHNQRLGLIDLKPSTERLFVFHLFNTKAVRNQIQASSTGTKVKHTSPSKILSIEIPVPPLTLQQEFARRIAAVERLKTTQRASLAEMDALFAVLQHRAFRGEI